jgi:hypothetical protein
VAECCLASRALEDLADAGVDVTLIDIGISGRHGIDAAARLCATPGAPPSSRSPRAGTRGRGGRRALSGEGSSVRARPLGGQPYDTTRTQLPADDPVLCAGLVWATAITSKDKGRLAEI